MGDKPFKQGRAWVEVDLNAISHNIREIRSKTPKNCELMVVLKADAYGHGVKKVAKRMVQEGIKAFAVATLTEGIQLRKYINDGSILILGYTHPKDSALLAEYALAQIIFDAGYAKELDAASEKINVHIAINTGMNRLGIAPYEFDDIESIFHCKNLTVEGIATHLSASDSLENNDVDFTKSQIEKFTGVVKKLKEKGYNPGKQHLQSSYGIYNYPELENDYVRPGIMLFGVQSKNGETKIKTELIPALSVKAVIAQVRWIEAGESVSYSRTYTADKPMKLATVCIGYADGIPRQMSGNGGFGLVHGHKVPVVGRICMDSLILDVTGIENVKAGDTATLIGKDRDEEIRCEDVAEAAGTITNDILSRLGNRLKRIYK